MVSTTHLLDDLKEVLSRKSRKLCHIITHVIWMTKFCVYCWLHTDARGDVCSFLHLLQHQTSFEQFVVMLNIYQHWANTYAHQLGLGRYSHYHNRNQLIHIDTIIKLYTYIWKYNFLLELHSIKQNTSAYWVWC